MKILRLLALAAILGVTLVGCRKELPTTIDPRDRIASNWSDAFEAYWDGINHNYVFWDVDSTDWDKVYADYKPKFANLKLHTRYDDSLATSLIKEMSKTLIDHHMAVTVKTNSYSGRFIPSQDEVEKRSYYHDLYDKGLLYGAVTLNEIAGRITNMEYGEQPGPDKDEKIEVLSYLIDGNVAYLTFNHFYLSLTMSEKPEGPVAVAYGNFLNIIENTPGLKGIIVDVRQNGGGDISDTRVVMGPLISENLFFGHSHTKNGLGRLDYSPWTPWLIEPIKFFSRPITVPIVALIDINSASMSEMTAQAIQALPNGHVIGERSYGGLGPIATPFREAYAGPYDTDVIKVYTSSHRSADVNGKCLEGIGITPDLEVLLDMEDMNDNVDNQLERAIKYIHNGN